MFYLTSKLHVNRVNTFGFMEGGGAFEVHPPGPGIPKKPRPNRVKGIFLCTSSSAFFYLYNIRHIRKFLSRRHTETLILAFITSELDYTVIVFCMVNYLVELSASFSEFKMRAPVSSTAPPSFTRILIELHWLLVRQRITFKLLLITIKSLHQLATS